MDDIITIDCEYLGHQQFAAAYLIADGNAAAFIDNGTNAAVPRLLSALEDRSLKPENVEYVIITHVHLDHAGGTSTLMKACPNAKLLAHPRAAKHMIDPSRLIESATAVYGESRFTELYGTIEPIASDRVEIMEDNDAKMLGGRRLRFLHTRGHANHHFVIVDDASKSIFCGDAFGVHYPALQREGVFALPSTSPTDFDGPLARESIERIVKEKPERVYPTHFGAVTEVEAAGDMMIRHLHFHEQVMLDASYSEFPDDKLTEYCLQRLRDYYVGLLHQQGELGREDKTWKLLELDIDLNAQGLAWVANKLRKKSREADH